MSNEHAGGCAVDGDAAVNFKMRDYQVEMYERSLKGNVIVAMDTGSGKTAIAILRMMAELDRCQSNKLIWFLAPTVALCTQQLDYVQAHLPAVRSRMLVGSDSVDRWSEQRIWDAALEDMRIVVSTHAVLADALGHGFVKISNISLLIFDEAHHCSRKHPANRIMQEFYHPAKAEDRAVPHILGLSATPILRSKLSELEKVELNLDSISVTPRVHRTEMLQYVHRPEFERLEYIPWDQSSTRSDKLSRLGYVLRQAELEQASSNPAAISEKPAKLEWVDQLVKFHRKATHIFEELGVWAAEYFVLQTVSILFGETEASERLFVGPKDDARRLLIQALNEDIFRRPHSSISHKSSLSFKVEQLISFLEQQDADNTSGLIFVRQRAVVSVLHTILSLHPRTAGRFQCATFVGLSNNAKRSYGLSELLDVKAQQDTMAAFRAGRKNLVIATDVLEEGIDVSACNLVVCFDPPQNLKSFMQRRGRARKIRSKFVILLPRDGESKVDTWEELEQELIKKYQDENRKRLQIQHLEEEDEAMDYKLHVESTGASLSADSTMGHLYHFCATLPQQPYVSMLPVFSLDEDSTGKITATVTLPNCVSAAVRTAKAKGSWRTERAALKDAAFQSYAALYEAGLLNDNLLPLIHDWQDETERPEDPPATLSVDAQLTPSLEMAKAWADPTLYQIRLALTEESGSESSMLLTTSMSLPQLPPLTLYHDAEHTFTIEFQDAIRREALKPESLQCLREITHLLDRSTHSDRGTSAETDFVYLFSPDIAEEGCLQWLAANRQRKNAVDVFQQGSCEVNGFVRSPSLYGDPHIFRRWHGDAQSLLIECVPLPRRRNFLHPNTSARIPDDDQKHTRQIAAEGCTIDALDSIFARFSLFIPSVVQHIETCTVATQLQKEVLATVAIQDINRIVTAIATPSANWISDYQSCEFVGDAVLKFAASVQLYADHDIWPEGFLTQRRAYLVSNANLARAAISKKLDRYILTDVAKGKKWSPPRISDAKQGQREMRMKVLADVTEALIGAAFLDSGFDAARACISIFIPEIRAEAPIVTSPLAIREADREMVEAESLIGYRFQNKTLLYEAFTHPTYVRHAASQSYERLEFLGDAVLDMLIVEFFSRQKPVLSQGRMTRAKAALVNANLLGFFCMSFSAPRTVNDIREASGVVEAVSRVENVPLWKYMLHYSQKIVEVQKACSNRYESGLSEVNRHLEEGAYPWVQLAKLNLDKLFSDLIESIVGAIFVDSRGDLSQCLRFVDRIGLGPYMRRVTQHSTDVTHPRDLLQRLAGSSKVEFVMAPCEEGLYRCEVQIDGIKMSEIDGCLSKDEALVVAADAAVVMLLEKIE